MKVAVFRNVEFEYDSVWDQKHMPVSPEWVRMSGWLDLEFPPLTESEQRTAAELIALQKRHRMMEDTFKTNRKKILEERDALMKEAEPAA